MSVVTSAPLPTLVLAAAAVLALAGCTVTTPDRRRDTGSTTE